MTEMTRTFGLELLESVLNDFPGVFLQVPVIKWHQVFFFFSDPFFSLPLSIYNSICPIFKILPSCHLCSLLASGVQFFAEGTGLSACYQTLLSQHQVQTRQQQRCLTSTCGETLLSYLHETASCGVGPHQTLLQLTSKKLNHRVVFSPDQICDWCDVGFFQLMYLFYT